MNRSLDTILKRLSMTDEHLTYLIGKIHFYHNEVAALRKRIILLEKENESLKTKRDFTVGKLKNLMQKFDDEGF